MTKVKSQRLTKALFAAAMIAGAAGTTVMAQTATPAASDRTGTNQAERAGTETPAARGVILARDAIALATRARENRDGVAMLVAARELRAAGLQASDGPTTTTTANPGATSTSSGPAPTSTPVTVASLFAEAKALARGDRDLLRRIAQAESGQAKGLVNGPTTFVRDIAADSHINWTVRARGGEVWRVGALGDGDTDVDIRVFDENDNLVCQDNGPSATAVCSFSPRWTGTFTVQVINYGSVWTRTVIASN